MASKEDIDHENSAEPFLMERAARRERWAFFAAIGFLWLMGLVIAGWSEDVDFTPEGELFTTMFP